MKKNFMKTISKMRKSMSPALVRCMVVAVCMLAVAGDIYAGSAGASQVQSAIETDIGAYWGPTKLGLRIIGGILAGVGGFRVYNKWSNGDQDVQKTMVSWIGGIAFVLLVPTIIEAVFGIG